MLFNLLFHLTKTNFRKCILIRKERGAKNKNFTPLKRNNAFT